MSAVQELAVHDISFTEMEQHVVNWAREALELRHGAAGDPDGPLGIPDITAGPHEILVFLLRVQARANRVGELLAKTTQARSRAKRAQDQSKFSAEIAYDEAMRNNAARRTVEFTSARERAADAALDSLEQRRIAHHAGRLVSVTSEAYEVVSQVHWQLEGLRKDLRAMLHALQFETSLER